MKTYIANVSGAWYAVEYSERQDQVYSIGNDCPRMGGRWIADATKGGVRYVAQPSPSRKAAYAKACRHGMYGGELYV